MRPNHKSVANIPKLKFGYIDTFAEYFVFKPFMYMLETILAQGTEMNPSVSPLSECRNYLECWQPKHHFNTFSVLAKVCPLNYIILCSYIFIF